MAQPAKIRATVAAIEDHAPGLRSLVFEAERRVPKFRPGQFLHLALDPYDPSRHWPDSRCFSIASPPEDRHRIRITVSAVGRFTGRVMELEEGAEVWLKLPYGDFVVQPNGQMPVVFVAGGSGIAPFVSLLASQQVLSCPVRVLYGARNKDLLIYSDTLDQAANRWPDFEWTAFVEQGDLPRGGRQGRLTPEAALASVAGQPAVYYLSGPPAMIETMRQGLSAAGVPGGDIRIDAWD